MRVDRSFLANANKIDLTLFLLISLGATCYKGWSPRNKEEWIRIADLALEEAKRRGGNQAWLR